MKARFGSVLARLRRSGGGQPPLAEALTGLGQLVLAERFMAPGQVSAIRFPGSPELAAAPGGLLLFLVSPGQGWRGARLGTDAFDGDGVSLGFAALAAGPAGVGLLAIKAAAEAAAALSPAQVATIERSMESGLLAERAPIYVGCNGAVAGAGASGAPPAAPAMAVLRPFRPATRAPTSERPRAPKPEAVWAVERSWQEGGDTFVEGWIHAFGRRVDAVRFERGGGEPVPSGPRRPRADLLPHYPMLPDGGAGAGFAVLVPGFRGPRLGVVLDTDDGPIRTELLIPPAPPSPGAPAERERAEAAERRFIEEVNGRRLELLELGGRIVVPWSESRRPAFSGAARYVGFDIHPAEGVDVVGDAHGLSGLVGPASFDAVMSLSVLEHIAMPWVVAAEINRTLRPGGLTHHVTHQSWPVHEQPNDFWRFTDEALALLFGPLHGFEVLGAGMAQRIRMYPEDRIAAYAGTPTVPGYGVAWVLSRKVADVPDRPAAAGDALQALSERYPRHLTPSPPP